jgi:hypothetical protein
MMRKIVIKEYEIPIQDEVTLELPAGSDIIKVGQHFEHTDKLRMWARVPKKINGVRDQYTIYIIGTNVLADMHPFGKHLETVITKDNVWHIYYVDVIRNDYDESNIQGE